MYLFFSIFFPFFFLIIIFNDFHLGREVHTIYMADGQHTVHANDTDGHYEKTSR